MNDNFVVRRHFTDTFESFRHLAPVIFPAQNYSHIVFMRVCGRAKAKFVLRPEKLRYLMGAFCCQHTKQQIMCQTMAAER